MSASHDRARADLGRLLMGVDRGLHAVEAGERGTVAPHGRDELVERRERARGVLPLQALLHLPGGAAARHARVHSRARGQSCAWPRLAALGRLPGIASAAHLLELLKLRGLHALEALRHAGHAGHAAKAPENES